MGDLSNMSLFLRANKVSSSNLIVPNLLFVPRFMVKLLGLFLTLYILLRILFSAINFLVNFIASTPTTLDIIVSILAVSISYNWLYGQIKIVLKNFLKYIKYTFERSGNNTNLIFEDISEDFNKIFVSSNAHKKNSTLTPSEIQGESEVLEQKDHSSSETEMIELKKSLILFWLYRIKPILYIFLAILSLFIALNWFICKTDLCSTCLGKISAKFIYYRLNNVSENVNMCHLCPKKTILQTRYLPIYENRNSIDIPVYGFAKGELDKRTGGLTRKGYELDNLGVRQVDSLARILASCATQDNIVELKIFGYACETCFKDKLGNCLPERQCDSLNMALANHRAIEVKRIFENVFAKYGKEADDTTMPLDIELKKWTENEKLVYPLNTNGQLHAQKFNRAAWINVVHAGSCHNDAFLDSLNALK